MQLTIGKKLGLALGTVILLSAIGAALTYVTVHDLVSVATPTRENCADLTQEIKRSVDAVSGYLVAGGNSFRNDRENAWERIDSASGRLDSLISTSRENADRTILINSKPI